jgi:hypothetical protein
MRKTYCTINSEWTKGCEVEEGKILNCGLGIWSSIDRVLSQAKPALHESNKLWWQNKVSWDIQGSTNSLVICGLESQSGGVKKCLKRVVAASNGKSYMSTLIS